MAMKKLTSYYLYLLCLAHTICSVLQGKKKKLEQWKQFLTQRTYSLKNRHWEERTCCEIEEREQSIVITLVIVCSQLIIITERANF